MGNGNRTAFGNLLFKQRNHRTITAQHIAEPDSNKLCLSCPVTGSILPGITRNSAIQLCKQWGYEVEERKISADELLEAQKNGTLEEVFGTGTAAVVSPVKELVWKDDSVTISNGQIGELTQKLYDTLRGIQMGTIEAPEGWITVVE